MESTISIIKTKKKSNLLIQKILSSGIVENFDKDWERKLLNDKFIRIDLNISNYKATLEIGNDAFINWDLDWRQFRERLFFRLDIINAVKKIYQIMDIGDNIIFMSDTDSEIGTLYMLVTENHNFEDITNIISDFKVISDISTNSYNNNGEVYFLNIWG